MRSRIYQALSGSTELTDIVGPRIFQASDVLNVPNRPFIIYRMHNAYRGQGLGRKWFIQVWCHDEPGDYMQIDTMMELCREAIEAIPHTGDFLEAVWVEDSVDLKDDDMNTICRNARFLGTQTLKERFT